MEVKGKKFDQQKPMWHLLPFRQLTKVVEVLTFGAAKYGENDWQHFVSKNKNENRYLSAAMRHLTARMNGEANDEETGKPHLAHAVCCLLFVMWKDDHERLRSR